MILALPAMAAGLALSLSPGMSGATYSAVVAVYLLMNGAAGLALAWRFDATRLRGQAVLGFISMLLAVMVIADWPVAELWGVSLALGISLAADGSWLTGLGARYWREARRVEISEKGEIR